MKDISDKRHEELSPAEIFTAFEEEYINDFTPIDITEAMFSHFSSTKSEEANSVGVRMRVVIDGEPFNLEAEGNGRLDAVSNALKKTQYHFDYKFITYSEHAIGSDSNSKAAAYVASLTKPVTSTGVSEPMPTSSWHQSMLSSAH